MNMKCWFCKGDFKPYYDEERTSIFVDEYDVVAHQVVKKLKYIHVDCKEYAMEFLRDIEREQDAL